ncbi:hypothetical protein MRX96_038211 [Rhipicephalus microplus]
MKGGGFFLSLCHSSVVVVGSFEATSAFSEEPTAERFVGARGDSVCRRLNAIKADLWSNAKKPPSVAKERVEWSRCAVPLLLHKRDVSYA